MDTLRFATRSPGLGGDLDELETHIEAPVRVPTATFFACQSVPARVDGPRATQSRCAMWALINVGAPHRPPATERQNVATRLARDAEVAASQPPLGPVRRDPPPACAVVGGEVGQFVPQSAVHLTGELRQPRVKLHLGAFRAREARRAHQPPVPAHRHPVRQRRATDPAQEFGGLPG